MQILKKLYYLVFDLVQTLVIAGAIFVVIYAFLFRPYQVNGLSMFPNFDDGEYVLTNLIDLRIGKLERGDIVVFNSPVDPEKDYIKRIIGIPNDTISLDDGQIYINGKKIDQSFLPSDVYTNPGSFLREDQSVVTPANQYFVMGDNRENSSDSREWGFVDKGEIIGKSFLVYWPINKLRLVKHTVF